MHRKVTALLFGALLLMTSTAAIAQANTPSDAPLLEQRFLDSLVGDWNQRQNAIAWIEKNWQPEFAPFAFESMALMRDRRAQLRLLEILQDKTGQSIGFDLRGWMQWIWQSDPPVSDRYSAFKSALYGLLDPRFKAYFGPERAHTIRLTEAVWGGVAQDGIPPLRGPKMIPATQAQYLEDSNVVFGIAINGDARAYPKRILAWHEMFVDSVGGVPLAGVYCTLCGAVIAYGTRVGDTEHALGTSGFLYRSNKLMYDKATQSLWSTMRGTPVIGPLVGKGIQLPRYAVVTTTWGEWRTLHPETTVLAVNTGHDRDYAEGAAYRSYFATDALMFPVPAPDNRLKNKDEVFGLLLDGAPPTALAASFLSANPVHHQPLGSVQAVILTTPAGANRAYAAGDVKFARWDGVGSAVDASGTRWAISEDALTSPGGETLPRLPAHRAFWFGWHAAFPDTVLVH